MGIGKHNDLPPGILSPLIACPRCAKVRSAQQRHPCGCCREEIGAAVREPIVHNKNFAVSWEGGLELSDCAPQRGGLIERRNHYPYAGERHTWRHCLLLPLISARYCQPTRTGGGTGVGSGKGGVGGGPGGTGGGFGGIGGSGVGNGGSGVGRGGSGVGRRQPHERAQDAR